MNKKQLTTLEKRLIETVKNLCSGDIDIVALRAFGEAYTLWSNMYYVSSLKTNSVETLIQEGFDRAEKIVEGKNWKAPDPNRKPKVGRHQYEPKE